MSFSFNSSSCLRLMSLGFDCPQPWSSWDSMMLGELGPWAPDLESKLKQTRVLFLLFGGEPEKQPKEGQNIQHPIFDFLRFGPWKDLKACGAKSSLSCPCLDK